MSIVNPGVYKHYKGKQYKVIAEARHSETEEELVVYQCLYGEFSTWVRPKAMFLEQIEFEGEMIPRFKYIGEG